MTFNVAYSILWPLNFTLFTPKEELKNEYKRKEGSSTAKLWLDPRTSVKKAAATYVRKNSINHEDNSANRLPHHWSALSLNGFPILCVLKRNFSPLFLNDGEVIHNSRSPGCARQMRRFVRTCCQRTGSTVYVPLLLTHVSKRYWA
jgi:hypothetical protein